MVNRRNLCTPAWLLTGIVSRVPGVLELEGGRLAFVTTQRRLFEVAVSEMSDVSFPWYYFGGGIKFRIGDERYRVSFVEPGDTGDIVEGRRAGKAWKKALSSGRVQRGEMR